MAALRITSRKRRSRLMSALGALGATDVSSTQPTAVFLILVTSLVSATAQFNGGEGLDMATTLANTQFVSSSTLLNLRGVPLGQDLSTFLRQNVADDVNDVSKPPGVPPFSGLRVLDLSNTNISGAIPPELGNLTSLVYLNLSSNRLSGPLPPELSKLSKLRYLDLSANELSGHLSPQLESLFFRRLKTLDLSSNKLSGPVSITVNSWGIHDVTQSTDPWSIVDVSDIGRQNGAGTTFFFEDSLARPLTHLDLSANQFWGPIPDLITFAHLTYLNLSSNHFSGGVGNGNLISTASLQTVDVSSNPYLIGHLSTSSFSVDTSRRLSLVNVSLQGTKLRLATEVKKLICEGTYSFNVLTNDGLYPAGGAHKPGSGYRNRCSKAPSSGLLEGGWQRQFRRNRIEYESLFLFLYLPQWIVILGLVSIFISWGY